MISNSTYFNNITNSNNPDCQERKDVENLKSFIATSFKEKNSFANFLLSLSIEDKSCLIKALITNDTEIIINYLWLPIKAQYPLYTNIKPERLKYLTELSSSDKKNELLSSFIQMIIKFLLKDSSNIIQGLIIQKAMQQILDTEFDFQLKNKIVYSINTSIADNVQDLTYNPRLQKMENNKYEGNISINEYNIICKNDSLDYSEFIICTLGVLQGVIFNNADAVKDLMRIRKLYDELEYRNAISEIKEFCNKYSINNNLKRIIIDKASRCAIPNGKNYTRRFYQNRLMQIGSHEVDLKKINKICTALWEINISSLDEISNVTIVYGVRDVSDEDILYRNRLEHLLNLPRLKTKKEGILANPDEFDGQISDIIWSRNPGIMLSSQPNFSDEITVHNLRNRGSDKNILPNPFNLEDKQALDIFVGSISGHAFNIVVVAENYMKKYKNDPSLSSDVNHFLRVLIMSYVHHGYHSYMEMVTVFKNPLIEKMFAAYNVTLDFNWDPKIIEQAMKDTQEYTKTHCLKKSLLTELKVVCTSTDQEINQFRLDLFTEKKRETQMTSIIALTNSLRGLGFFGMTSEKKEAIKLAKRDLEAVLYSDDSEQLIHKRCCAIINKLKKTLDIKSDADLNNILEDTLKAMHLTDKEITTAKNECHASFIKNIFLEGKKKPAQEQKMQQ